MAARAMWKGVVALRGVEVPVKLYSGIQAGGIHFRLLHERDRAPVKSKMINPLTNEDVSGDEVQKGAPVAPGRFVVLTDDDLASIEPKESRTIEVTKVVPSGALDHAYYDRPYWLGPDGSSARYAALVEALRGEEREGIAHWVMRKRAYTGALRVRDDHLVLITLRHGGEVIEPKEIAPPKGRAPDAKELDMARQLVEMLAGPFEPDQYHDEYRERVLELVRRKARGGKIRLPRKPAKRPTPELAQALRKSIAAMSGKRAASASRGKRAHG